MKTYNFKAQFAGRVERGEKLTTIRANGKRTPPYVGERLRFYTGMRTKQCRLLGEGECTACVSVKIVPLYAVIGGRIVTQAEIDRIAQQDGFKNAEEMRGWFADVHGLPFEGWLITWRKLS